MGDSSPKCELNNPWANGRCSPERSHWRTVNPHKGINLVKAYICDSLPGKRDWVLLVALLLFIMWGDVFLVVLLLFIMWGGYKTSFIFPKNINKITKTSKTILFLPLKKVVSNKADTSCIIKRNNLKKKIIAFEIYDTDHETKTNSIKNKS